MLIVAIIIFIAGTLITAKGYWFDPSRGQKRCPICWYPFCETFNSICNECGYQISTNNELYAIRHNRALITAGVVVIAASAFVYFSPFLIGPAIYRKLPTSLLLWALPKADGGWWKEFYKRGEFPAAAQAHPQRILDMLIETRNKNADPSARMAAVAGLHSYLDSGVNEAATPLAMAMLDSDSTVAADAFVRLILASNSDNKLGEDVFDAVLKSLINCEDRNFGSWARVFLVKHDKTPCARLANYIDLCNVDDGFITNCQILINRAVDGGCDASAAQKRLDDLREPPR